MTRYQESKRYPDDNNLHEPVWTGPETGLHLNLDFNGKLVDEFVKGEIAIEIACLKIGVEENHGYLRQLRLSYWGLILRPYYRSSGAAERYYKRIGITRDTTCEWFFKAPIETLVIE